MHLKDKYDQFTIFVVPIPTIMRHLTLSSMVAGLLILQVSICTAQVGINTTTPRTTLEVGGSMLISDDLKIGIIKSMDDQDTSTFLIQNNNDDIKALDVSNPTGAALGYIQEYVITNANLDWVLNFDTQVDANNFDLISISAYYDTELALTGNLDKFSLPYTAAFVQNGTWRIIADFPAAQNLNTNAIGTWIITTLIFSKDLSKQLGVIEVPMNQQTTASAVSPIID